MGYSFTKGGIKWLKENYGVEFNLSAYLSQSQKTSPNDALIAAFGELYQQVLLKDTLNAKGDRLLSTSFFKDFKDTIIDRLIWELPLNRRDVPNENAGLTKHELHGVANGFIALLPQNDVEAVMKNYLAGNIRIRDMKNFARNVDKFGGLDKPENRKILASYAEALKRVNESRTTGWRWTHWFRNNAEQRDSKFIEDLLKKNCDSLILESEMNQVSSKLSVLDTLQKATVKSIFGVEKIEDYVEEVQPEDQEPLEHYQIKQNEFKKMLEDIEKEDERQRQEQLLREQEEERKEKLRIEQEKEMIKKQREEEKRQKEEKIRNNPDAAKSPEQIQKEAQDEINNFLANLNAQIKQREEDNKALSTHLSLDELKEDIYANNEENSKIEESSIENPNLNKEP